MPRGLQSFERLISRWQVTQFFVQFPDGICNFLGIEIGYTDEAKRQSESHSLAASLSLWASEPVEDGIDVNRIMTNRMFRDEHGEALPGELRLPFTYFLPFSEHSKLPPTRHRDTDIHLSFARLCELIGRAERRQRTIEAAPTLPVQRVKKRIRFKDEDGTVTLDTQISPEPKRRRVGSNADMGLVSIGRTSSQTRSASQPRRSARSRSRG